MASATSSAVASSTPSVPAQVIFRTKITEVSLGMVLLGVIFSSVLYGVMLTQTYKYFERFKRDPPLVKLLVFAVLLLNTISVFFVGHAAWYYLVTTGAHGLSIWSLNVELALSMAMSAISETYLATRVFKLSGGKYWLTALLLAMAFLHFGSGEVAAIEFLLLKRFAKFGSVKVPSILRLTSAAVCDTSIAISLSYFLHKKRTGFKKTDEIINYLILFSINTGLLTSVTSIASVITYMVVPRTWVYTALCFLLSRLYATTFLCSLNSRQILRSQFEAGIDSDSSDRVNFPKLRPQWSVIRRSKGSGEKSPTQIDVLVVRETQTISDGPQLLSSVKLRNPNGQLREIMEKTDSSTSSSSTLARTTTGTSSSSTLERL